ncbi:FecR family protein [Lacimicrobium alkaliphilum]|uniref:Transcriptional regulator n=1 Tax=Lacimicrobium alkaliphilum TaxID=1526571 RepID=A0ABQ1QYH3_9ALTE|nr:FecR domain-containing protein [Lacimicrobium alkaliphilum]GGD49248.1 transcriptional regulator [Lacimicrobium alkaliphilum]
MKQDNQSPENVKSSSLESQIWNDPALHEALSQYDIGEQNKNQKNVIAAPANKPLFSIATWPALAASFAIIWLLWTGQPTTHEAPHPLPTLTLDSQAHTRDVDLADGTEVALNRHVKMHFYQDDKLRSVDFEQGEAFFDVARHQKKPFVVQTRDAKITVIGTAFNVDVAQSHSQIEVYHGRVKVTSEQRGEEIILTKGQAIELTPEGIITTKSFSRKTPLWQQGWMEFSDHSLEHVIEKLNRYSDKKLILSNNIRQLMVSGRFKTEAPVDAVKLLAQMHELRLTVFSDSIVIDKE